DRIRVQAERRGDRRGVARVAALEPQAWPDAESPDSAFGRLAVPQLGDHRAESSVRAGNRRGLVHRTPCGIDVGARGIAAGELVVEALTQDAACARRAASLSGLLAHFAQRRVPSA